MWSMIWPIALVVLANIFYNICTKSTPNQANAFLSLCITYLVAASGSYILFLFSGQSRNIGSELSKLNWTSIVLGISVVALEFGYICIYRAGWKMGIGSLVANIFLTCALLFVGLLFYKESISARQIVGIVVCAIGLFLVSK